MSEVRQFYAIKSKSAGATWKLCSTLSEIELLVTEYAKRSEKNYEQIPLIEKQAYDTLLAKSFKLREALEQVMLHGLLGTFMSNGKNLNLTEIVEKALEEFDKETK